MTRGFNSANKRLRRGPLKAHRYSGNVQLHSSHPPVYTKRAPIKPTTTGKSVSQPARS